MEIDYEGSFVSDEEYGCEVGEVGPRSKRKASDDWELENKDFKHVITQVNLPPEVIERLDPSTSLYAANTVTVDNEFTFLTGERCTFLGGNIAFPKDSKLTCLFFQIIDYRSNVDIVVDIDPTITQSVIFPEWSKDYTGDFSASNVTEIRLPSKGNESFEPITILERLDEIRSIYSSHYFNLRPEELEVVIKEGVEEYQDILYLSSSHAIINALRPCYREYTFPRGTFVAMEPPTFRAAFNEALKNRHPRYMRFDPGFQFFKISAANGERRLEVQMRLKVVVMVGSKEASRLPLIFDWDPFFFTGMSSKFEPRE
jgi:hypothetical protein